MIALALAVGAFYLIRLSARGLDDRAPQDESRGLDWLLFALCLIGVLASVKRRDEDDD